MEPPPANTPPAGGGPKPPVTMAEFALTDGDAMPRTLPVVDLDAVAPPPDLRLPDPALTTPGFPALPSNAVASKLLSAAAALPTDRTVALSPRAKSDPPPAPPIVQPPSSGLPLGSRPRLRVLRGLKLNVEYPIYDGPNTIGRRDDAPVDIDLEDQEPADRIWSSRRHAILTLADGHLVLEDLNSLNGTFVNRNRLPAGSKRPVGVNDVIQIGTIQLKVTV